jgi:LmbE family N-acetylglucosaminyl deacetylase
MKNLLGIVLFAFGTLFLNAQQYNNLNSAEILHELQKINVSGAVLYIAAHPDDENTRLLAYLANERKVRTGYLSLTRGDGGQNLIGNEQGVDLGLIRTQELLAARRVDGAEQFFTSAYDFGYSKTSEETFKIWDKQKVLSDVVWVIRQFKPDVIIARFPEDTRAGHGHHAASGILAREAFYAAADKTKFPEQFKQGVSVWQAKRVLWNTFNFGGNNTTSDQQLKIDVGQYNNLLGKSYGEIAALSRSQHKSQGFGVPSSRGSQIEYFTHIGGDTAHLDILDDVVTTLDRYNQNRTIIQQIKSVAQTQQLIDDAIANFNFLNVEKNLTRLIALFRQLKADPLIADKSYKLEKLQKIILSCAGFYAEATTNNAFAVQGDSLKINFTVNSRLADSIKLDRIFYKQNSFSVNTILNRNRNFTTIQGLLLRSGEPLTQPYWLELPKTIGNFTINQQKKVGQPDVDYEKVQFAIEISGELFIMEQNIQYKYTDPVKGEIFQPLYIVPAVNISVQQEVALMTPNRSNPYEVWIQPKTSMPAGTYRLVADSRVCDTIYMDYLFNEAIAKGQKKSVVINNHGYKQRVCGAEIAYTLLNEQNQVVASKALTTIQYDHIPTIAYTTNAVAKLRYEDIKSGKFVVGYINGAGDKTVEALQQLGYEVEILDKETILKTDLKKYKAIVTGVRAYNTNTWMNDVYDKLMQYMNNGGNIILQYNTSNNIGPIKAKMAPYKFNISRNRITDEKADVRFLNKKDVVLNKPNQIVAVDFNNWIQERTIYEATELAPEFRTVFEMNDPGEKPQSGGLIIAPVGSGNIVYCSLVLFRQLPAGNTGAYKLLANLVELPQNKNSEPKGKK